jgi:hypothetical protein
MAGDLFDQIDRLREPRERDRLVADGLLHDDSAGSMT